MMDIVARDLRTANELIVYHSNWYNPPLLDSQGEPVSRLFPPEEHRFGIHGGDIETSMMLALNPARVDMSQAQNFRSTSQDRSEKYPLVGNGVTAKLGWQMQDYNVMGAAGNAAAGTSNTIDAAHARDMSVVALCGSAVAPWHSLLNETDVLVSVPHDRAARVLELQLLVLHCLCDAVDLQLMGEQETQ